MSEHPRSVERTKEFPTKARADHEQSRPLCDSHASYYFHCNSRNRLHEALRKEKISDLEQVLVLFGRLT
jgi:hypothetical protein